MFKREGVPCMVDQQRPTPPVIETEYVLDMIEDDAVLARGLAVDERLLTPEAHCQQQMH